MGTRCGALLVFFVTRIAFGLQEDAAPFTGPVFLLPVAFPEPPQYGDVVVIPPQTWGASLARPETGSIPHRASRCFATLLCCASAAMCWRRRQRFSRKWRRATGRSSTAQPPTMRAAQHACESRVFALIGRDGVGKSKLCAALLDDADSGDFFADKSKLLEMESAENRRNFSCYRHVYSRRVANNGCRLHLIDTPGHVDRLPLVEQSLRIAHGAVMVTTLETGIDAACGRAVAAAERARKPLAVFLNGIDRVSDQQQFEDCVEMLEARLGVPLLVLYAPIYAPDHDSGSWLLDVLQGTLCSSFECRASDSARAVSEAVARHSGAVTLKERIVETLTDVDEDLMVEYIDKEGDVSLSSIEAAMRRAVACRKVVPLVAGSAKTGLGVDALMDVMSTFFPPMDGDRIARALGITTFGSISSSRDAAFTAWATNVHNRKGERLMEFQVLGGTLAERQELKFVGGERFTPNKLFVKGYQGELVSVSRVGSGDLAFTPAPQSMSSLSLDGVMLADQKLPIKNIESPEGLRSDGQSTVQHCVFALKLEDMNAKQRTQLMEALKAIEQDDEGLHVEVDPITHETRLSCMGMLHAELLKERLAEHFKILHLPLGRPKVAYLATLRHAAVATGKHQPSARTHIRKGIAHTHQGKADASVKLEMVPAERGYGVEFEDSELLNQQHGMRQSIEDALQTAGPGGIPVTDVQVRLLGADAAKEDAAVAAAVCAVQEAVKETSRIALLEPIATLEVDVPGEVAESVAEDLRARGGGLLYTQPSEGDDKLLAAEVPLREILEYPKDLQKLTGGEGSCSYKVESYREVPMAVQKDIVEQELR